MSLYFISVKMPYMAWTCYLKQLIQMKYIGISLTYGQVPCGCVQVSSKTVVCSLTLQFQKLSLSTIYQSNILILLCWWSFPVFLLTVKVQDQFMISWWKVIICFRVVLQRLVRSSVHSRQGPPPSSVIPPPPSPVLKSQTQQQITDWPTWLPAQYNRYSSNLYHIALRFVCLAHLTLTSNRHSRREHHSSICFYLFAAKIQVLLIPTDSLLPQSLPNVSELLLIPRCLISKSTGTLQ